mmetsp:Transcript_65832/g.140850  ORF Transcript_65832/g.140850 Transcript_65832/m.140850 type:complete len:200 (-) Transcript_65832:114-713(-)
MASMAGRHRRSASTGATAIATLGPWPWRPRPASSRRSLAAGSALGTSVALCARRARRAMTPSLAGETHQGSTSRRPHSSLVPSGRTPSPQAATSSARSPQQGPMPLMGTSPRVCWHCMRHLARLCLLPRSRDPSCRHLAAPSRPTSWTMGATWSRLVTTARLRALRASASWPLQVASAILAPSIAPGVWSVGVPTSTAR